jgi:hypothetical protein
VPLKNVLSVIVLLNHPGTPKLCAIAHENGPKTQKRRVFGHATQTCTNSHGPCKSPQNLKLWAIAHKNGHKRKNDELFCCHSSLKCTNYHIPCKCLWNPKTMCNSSRKQPKNTKRRVFGRASQKYTNCHSPCKSPQNPKTEGNSS